mgnify:CR=1 FL=1
MSSVPTSSAARSPSAVFDPFDPAHLADPYPAYQALRDTDPTLLHAALRSTTVLSVETLRAVSDLEDCWDHLVSPPSFDDVDADGGASGPRGGDDDGVVAASFDDEE